MAKRISLTVNSWSVEQDLDGRRKQRPCALAIECGGKDTQGVAVFARDGEAVEVKPGIYKNPACCSACAIAFVMREGLKGAITVKRMVEVLSQ